jgi:hypothetical protein
MLDLDAVVDLDTSAYDLDGVPTGTPVTPPVTLPGGHTSFKVRPKVAQFVPRKERIVGHATATLGPLEAHAHAVIVHDGTARARTRSRARAEATRTVISHAATGCTVSARCDAGRTVYATTAARLRLAQFGSDARRTVYADGTSSGQHEARADATVTRIGTATTRCDCTAEGLAFVTLDIRAQEAFLLLL